MKSYKIVISGKVTNVGYRQYVREIAKKLNISGFVKYEGNNIYAEAEGDDYSLSNFVECCKDGNGISKVSNIKVIENRLHNFKTFEIESRKNIELPRKNRNGFLAFFSKFF